MSKIIAFNNKSDELDLYLTEDDFKFVKSVNISNINKEIYSNNLYKHKFNVVLTNDGNNIIYDVLSIPKGTNKKIKDKAVNNLIQKYGFISKNKYLIEESKLIEDNNSELYLVKFISKEYISNLLSIDKLEAVYTDVEVISNLKGLDGNTIVVNYNDVNIIVLALGKDIMYFNKINREGSGELNGREVMVVNDYIKSLLYENSYRVDRIVLLKGTEETSYMFKDICLMEDVTVNNELLFMLYNKKKGFVEKYVLSKKFNKAMSLVVALILTINLGVFTLNQRFNSVSNELKNRYKSLRSNNEKLLNEIDILGTEINSMESRIDYINAINKIKQYRNVKLSGLLNLLPTVTPKNIYYTDISLSENNRANIVGRTNNYSDVGFLIKLLDSKGNYCILNSVS
ncbi:MAG: hypothetical protein QXD03_02690, partial [Candidatus Anstonellales archaeon]